MANKAKPDVMRNGKQLYRCEVERQYEGVFYVWAESREEAQNDANELMVDWESDFWGLPEDDVYVLPARQAPESGEPVWSGGPDGQWDDWSD